MKLLELMSTRYINILVFLEHVLKFSSFHMFAIECLKALWTLVMAIPCNPIGLIHILKFKTTSYAHGDILSM
jgi:hypothetical protein